MRYIYINALVLCKIVLHINSPRHCYHIYHVLSHHTPSLHDSRLHLLHAIHVDKAVGSLRNSLGI